MFQAQHSIIFRQLEQLSDAAAALHVADKITMHLLIKRKRGFFLLSRGTRWNPHFCASRMKAM